MTKRNRSCRLISIEYVWGTSMVWPVDDQLVEGEGLKAKAGTGKVTCSLQNGHLTTWMREGTWYRLRMPQTKGALRITIVMVRKERREPLSH